METASDSSAMTPYKYQDIPILVDQSAEPWMTQQQIADLLGITRQSVGDILEFAFRNGDLSEQEAVCRLRLLVENGKKYNVKHYNLDAILLIGFRSKASTKAILFRQWVKTIVRERLAQDLGLQVKQLETHVSQQKIRLYEQKQLIKAQEQRLLAQHQSIEAYQGMLEDLQAALPVYGNEMVRYLEIEDHLRTVLGDEMVDELFPREIPDDDYLID